MKVTDAVKSESAGNFLADACFPPPDCFLPYCAPEPFAGSKAMGKILGRIVVTITVGLISFIAFSSQLFIIWPWYGRELSVDLLKLLVPFKCATLAQTFLDILKLIHSTQHTGWAALLELLAMCPRRPWTCPHRMGKLSSFRFPVERELHLCLFFQKPDVNSAEGYEVKKLTGTPRFCRSCREYKPPRARTWAHRCPCAYSRSPLSRSLQDM